MIEIIVFKLLLNMRIKLKMQTSLSKPCSVLGVSFRKGRALWRIRLMLKVRELGRVRVEWRVFPKLMIYIDYFFV